MSETIAPPAHRMVDFGDAISLGFKNYANFQGRSSRGAYWYWALFTFILGLVTGAMDAILFPGNPFTPINSLLSLALFLPGLSLAVRRLHDIGKSGWWVLVAFTVILIILLIYWACQPGERATNNYGPDEEAGRAI